VTEDRGPSLQHRRPKDSSSSGGADSASALVLARSLAGRERERERERERDRESAPGIHYPHVRFFTEVLLPSRLYCDKPFLHGDDATFAGASRRRKQALVCVAFVARSVAGRGEKEGGREGEERRGEREREKEREKADLEWRAAVTRAGALRETGNRSAHLVNHRIISLAHRAERKPHPREGEAGTFVRICFASRNYARGNSAWPLKPDAGAFT